MNSIRQHECDVAIVGAGIGGLATCAALTKRYPGISISLFDAAAAPGGRIRSKRCSPQSGPGTPPATDVFELGAGRYHRTNHQRLHALVTSLGLRTHKFSYAMHRDCPSSQSDEVIASLHKLRALESGMPPTVSFMSAASAALGNTVFDRLVQMSGYDTLRCDDLPFEHGLGILCGHPETRSIWSTDWTDWRALSDGFSALTEALADNLSAQQQLFFRHRASRVTPLSRNAVELEVTSPNGRLLVSARQVICATSLFDFLTLYPAATEYVDYARHVVDVPLLKGYVQYDRAWWPQQEDKAAQVLGRCLVVPGGFRKVYLSASRPSLFFYCDGSSAIAQRRRLRHSDAPALLAKDLGQQFADVADVAVKSTDWKFWERGVSFWANGTQRIPGPIWQPAPNVFLQSDINTSALGWIEGALMAAEAAADEVSRGGGMPAVGKIAVPAWRRGLSPARQAYELA
jgi:monoamine oxidase